ncbi:MAG: hypothetical protein BA863_09175 [Desulfovibrio sp. S3730MH75]|nr:MAG: hypothetical protein BA863_09175 [Desulfovibrio sp. S3730MH75]
MQVDVQRFHSSSDTEKPLFIPLKTEYYEAFISGDKREELRAYGPRWNEKTCRIGRAVLLSKGYGKQNRATTKVTGFKKQHGSTFGSRDRDAIKACFGTLDIEIACIEVERPKVVSNE